MFYLERKMAKHEIDLKVGKPCPDFLELLTIAFIVLKLTGHISWSWWLVFAPLWLGVLIMIVGMILIAIFDRT